MSLRAACSRCRPFPFLRCHCANHGTPIAFLGLGSFGRVCLSIIPASLYLMEFLAIGYVQEPRPKKKSREVVGKLFVECRTTQREHTNELAESVEQAGAENVAMPGMQCGS